MQFVKPNEANYVFADLVDAAGEPIESGSVSFGLQAMSGDNALKWWDSATGSWSATAAVAGAGAHQSRSRWTCSIAAGAWLADTEYAMNAWLTTDTQIDYSDSVSTSGTSSSGGAVTEVAVCPISLELVKWHLRREGYEDDNAIIEQYMLQATDMVEKLNNRTLTAARTRVLSLDEFPAKTGGLIELPCPPLAGVTSVVYLDSDGDSQTLDAGLYRVDAAAFVGRLTPAYGESWPATYPVTNAITITYAAGYATAADVPPDAISAILRAIYRLYENRGSAAIQTDDLVLADRVLW